MLIPKCPTCGKCLACYQVPYEEQLTEIENDPSTTKDEKNAKQMELINSFGLSRWCCKMRLKTYMQQVKVII